jgi:hypothetical protein
MSSFFALLAQSGTGLRESFRLLDLPETWLIVLVILPVLGAIAYFGYRGEALATPMRWFSPACASAHSCCCSP